MTSIAQLFIALLYGLGITFIMLLIIVIVFIIYKLIVDFIDKLDDRKEYLWTKERLKNSVIANDKLLATPKNVRYQKEDDCEPR